MKAAQDIGFTYRQGDKTDLADKLKKMITSNHGAMGIKAYISAHGNFSASGMSKRYQELYSFLAGDR